MLNELLQANAVQKMASRRHQQGGRVPSWSHRQHGSNRGFFVSALSIRLVRSSSESHDSKC